MIEIEAVTPDMITSLKLALNAHMIDMEYTDLIVEWDHYDGNTNQVMVRTAGKFTRERRNLLESALRRVNRKVLVSQLVSHQLEE
jgi:uncharacterized protein YutD